MLELPDSWVWDFWLADDGESYHLFFLYASRALGDPDARHHRASVGHAVSTDLTSWTRVADALVRGDSPAFDDLATWTGSVVRHPDGTWFMFYTGATMTLGGNVQTIGYATSADLTTWTKSPDNPVLRADPRWYELLEDGQWAEEAFRDPWVFADPDGDGWHMLVTARARTGPADSRGALGHAWSPDLRRWELRAPLTAPEDGFGHLEVAQVEDVDGTWVVVFSCLATSADTRTNGTSAGVWVARGAGPLGPFDIANAQPLTGSDLYSGRLVRRRDSARWLLLAFHNDAADGTFVGSISDPMAVSWDGTSLVVTP
ncbi:family 43 glycosylhydrolase [Cellulomonas fengjieae]|uniref:family 43 glycosylhydrolase n=1 Tax=Cellulomonas fengjieae TaxID=2819978 RepID=UPI001AAF09B7|nr:family 43 glycosylhydrolase [Cellulomonas fengjieae]MBO3100916.1 family 43 glycosylhydrolase [Cellulomonas fengjieae]